MSQFLFMVSPRVFLNLILDRKTEDQTMKKTAILLVSTLMLGVSASAMADSNRWDHQHKDRYDYRYDRYDNRHDHRNNLVGQMGIVAIIMVNE
jgi:hypothetical protein